MSKFTAILSTNQKEYKSLAIMVALGLACFILALACLAFDQRKILNEYVWLKPCKFGLSIASYGACLLWFSRYVQTYKSFFAVCSKLALLGTVVELTALAVQAGNLLPGLQGVGPQHESLVLSLVAKLGIIPLATLMPVSLFILYKQKNLPPVLGSALLWATFIATLGMIPGIIMLLPGFKPFSQYANLSNGMTIISSQHISLSTWLGWSTIGGDLRAAHFFGLHALQVLPLAALTIEKYGQKWDSYTKSRIITNLGFTYTAYLGLTTGQALSGESIFHPSNSTIYLALTILSLSISFVLLAKQINKLALRDGELSNRQGNSGIHALMWPRHSRQK